MKRFILAVILTIPLFVSCEEFVVGGVQPGIIYVSSHKLSVDSSKFNVDIYSHTWDNGIGTISFDGELVEIKNYAFGNSTGLSYISLPSGVSFIGENAFRSSDLEEIELPLSLTDISATAFYDCCRLNKVKIPKNVNYIGNHAFYHCKNLKVIYCEATTPPDCGQSIFSTYSDMKIYVPRESVDKYKKAEGWKQYKNMIVGYNF